MLYAPPNATVEYHRNYLQSLPTQVVILGDFNMPDINWSTLSGSSTISNNFCKFIFRSNLEQLINHATGNILDLLRLSQCLQRSKPEADKDGAQIFTAWHTNF